MKTLVVFAFVLFCINGVAGEKIEIPSGTATISHSRGDLELEQISMLVGCFDKNGNWQACDDIKVDDTSIGESSIEFQAVSQYQAKIPRISVFSNDLEGFFCIGMKARFKGFPNVCDSILYPPYPNRRALDRYSILSYCSKSDIDEESGAGSRFSSRRVVNWEDYLYLLKQPISLVLTNATPDQCVVPD